MFFNRLLNNKYIFSAESFINNIKEYGFKNAVRISQRNKNNSYDILKNDFFYNDYCMKMCQLIEKKAGKDIYIENLEDFGYCVIAPVIYDFIKWLAFSADAYSEIWFLSREGWLLKRAFDIYIKKKNIQKKSVYFLASRRAASVAAIKNIDDIKEILSQYYRGSLKNLLSARLGIDLECQDFYVSMPNDIDKVMKLVNTDEVIEKSREEYKNYTGCIGNIKSNIAVADIGYQGTIQYYLSKMLNIKISGYYICSHYKNKPSVIGCRCSSLFPVINMQEEQTNGIFKNQLYFEAVLKAPFGQLIKFDSNYKPIYDNENDFDDNNEIIQKGILNFIEEFSCIDNMSFEKNTFSAELADVLIKANVSENILRSLKVEDKYCSDGKLTPVDL